MHLGWEAIMTSPSAVSEINDRMTELATEFANVAETIPELRTSKTSYRG
jgi:hypothetical protein